MLRVILAVAMAAVLAAPAVAQGSFSPVIRVGETVVTGYQIDQRMRFLTLLRAPGDIRALAREQLINEAIQLAAARDADLFPSQDDIDAGLEEFSSRANLSAAEFITALGANGVDAETFRDFITAGVAWRTLLRERFGDELRSSISDDQIESTLSRTGTEGGVRVLLSEIVLPKGTPETTAASRARAAELIGQIGTEADFATAARRFSASATRATGGERPWAAQDRLPPEVAAAVAPLAEGQVSRPVDLENSIALYLLRDRETVAAGTPDTLSVDYALLITGPDTPAPTAIRDAVDTCDDLYGVARGLPAERLQRETVDVVRLPADVRGALATLDPGEVALNLTRGGQPAVLMLCARTAGLESTVDRDIIANRLLNQRLGTTAVDYLAELRAQTVVTDLR